MSESLVRQHGGALTASGEEWQAIREQAAALIKSGFLPRSVTTPEKAIAIMLAGRELGLPPMQSIRAIAIVDGKPTLSAETMLALAYQRVPGLQVEVATTPDGATVTGNRPGGKPTSVTFGKAQATAAGLLSKDNWRKYPEAMYRARAISAWCRVVCPDAILGAYTPEELEPASRPAPVTVLPAELVDDPRPTQEEPPVLPADMGISASWPAEARDMDTSAAEESGHEEGPPPEDEDGQPLLTAPPARKVDRGAAISTAQVKRLWAISKKRQAALGLDDATFSERLDSLLTKYGYDSSNDIGWKDYAAIVAKVEAWT